MRLISLLLLAATTATPALAGDAPTEIDADAVWGLADSPMAVHEEFRVAAGAVLASTVALDATMALKIACGLGAVGVSVACAKVVFQRSREAREGASEERLKALTRWVWLSAAVGVPMALVALFVGGQRVGWW